MGDTAVQTGPDDESARARPASRPDPRPAVSPGSQPGEASDRIHLSQREVERVIARAVELQQDREVGRGTGLTLADLQAVVAQVGVEADLVRRALDEVRLGTAEINEQGWMDRVLGPRSVAGAAVVAGSPDEVSRGIATWMTTEEGMLLAGTRDGADRWVPDNRLLTQMRHGLKATRSEGALRGLRNVTARTESAADGTLVAIEADTSSIRTANAAVLSVSGLAGIGLGVAAAVFYPDSVMLASDAAQFSAGFAGPVAAGVGIATIVRRTWLGQVRRAVLQAIDGISMKSRDGDDTKPAASVDWRNIKRRWLGGS